MSNTHEKFFYLIKLITFTDLERLLKEAKTYDTPNDFRMIHLDFNLFAIDIHGQEILDTLDIPYDVFATNIPYANLLDFYDHDYRYKFSTEQFDFTPDYNSLLIEYNIEELTVRDLEVFNYNL